MGLLNPLTVTEGEAPTPEKGGGQLLLRVKAGGICSSDLYFFSRNRFPLELCSDTSSPVSWLRLELAQRVTGNQVIASCRFLFFPAAVARLVLLVTLRSVPGDRTGHGNPDVDGAYV